MLPIATTKLHAPRLGPAVVMRRRLLERLDEGLQAGRRLTLVEAPAGYGKTTLLSTWLHGLGRPFTWVSLDEGENDPGRLAACLIAALRKVAGDCACETAASLLRVPQAIPAESLATYLINDLDGLAEPIILVLDDYHLIEAQGVHRMVQAMLDRAPAALHMVIATRSDPPLPVARWRARGEVTEIRAGELRFTAAEAGEFLRSTMKVELPEADVAALETRTEGWVAGLQLAGLSLQGRGPDAARAFVQNFSGSHRYIIDYLADEVLREQSPAVRDFLCQTAILDRLSAPLCDAVTGGTESRATLAGLEQANLFLVPLDDHREWYRYHHLFRDVLRSELTEAERLPLYLRAAAWLEQNNQPGAALRHYLLGRAPGQAARLVRRCADGLLQAGDVRTLLSWLGALPEAEIAGDPELAVHRLWALFSSGQIAAAAVLIDQVAEVLKDTASDRLRGRMLCVQAWVAGFGRSPLALEIAGEALRVIPADDAICRSAATLAYGNILSAQDGGRATEPYFREAYELARQHGQTFVAMTALMDLVILLNTFGRRREAEALCVEGLRPHVDQAGRHLPVTGMVLIEYGALLYDCDRLHEARELITTGLEMCRRIGFEMHVAGDAAVLLARLRMAEGDAEGALDELRRAQELFARAGVATSARDASAVEMEILLRSGELETVARWAEQPGFSRTAAPWNDAPHLILARYYLATGRPSEAAGALTQIEEQARHFGHVRRLITVYILQAVALGELAYLERAVQLAAPEEYIRLFLDEGPAVVRLLPAVRAAAPNFVDRLLGAEPRRGAPVPAATGLGEHLTERELELLRLLAAGLSNEEIAARLFISVTTAKWHVRNVFDKLGVHSRTQAAARARELQLL